MRVIVTGLNARYLAHAVTEFRARGAALDNYLLGCFEGGEVYSARRVNALEAQRVETALHIASLVEFSGEVVEP